MDHFTLALVSAILATLISVFFVTIKKETITGTGNNGPHSFSVTKESWKRITAIDNYEEVAGVLFFTKVFTIAPEAYVIFSFSSEYQLMSKKMFDSNKFKKHAAGVIRMLNKAIEMLGPDMGPLLKILKGLGKRHAGYGVKKEHYPVIGQALIETLDDAMGDDFTDEVKSAWVEVWTIISATMMEGSDC